MFSIKIRERTYTIDLYKLSVADIRTLSDGKARKSKSDDEADAILARATSITIEDLRGMAYPDFRKLTRFFWECVSDPLKDEDDAKNSLSESTSA